MPSLVLDRIKSLCRNFLWGGKCFTIKKPLVSWKEVCLPKSEGGLGMLDMKEWNKALLVKTLWNIHQKKDTLWSKWVGSSWESLPRHEDSPLFKRLLYKKDNILSREGSTSLADCRLVSWVRGGEIQTREAYNYFRSQGPRALCFNVVWGSGITPKYCFVLWLAVKGKLLTRKKLHLKGQDRLCPLCRIGEETGVHLFFQCSFAAQIWKYIKNWLGLDREMATLNNNLKWPRKESKGKSMKAKANKIAASTIVYHLWAARNRSIFENRIEIINVIVRTIKYHICRIMYDHFPLELVCSS
jgi:hypothetical protein